MPPSSTAPTFVGDIPTVCTVGYKYVVGFADWFGRSSVTFENTKTHVPSVTTKKQAVIVRGWLSPTGTDIKAWGAVSPRANETLG